jgi:threonylcarbamoyladenosine tRNA methylthiotransferase MtaB
MSEKIGKIATIHTIGCRLNQADTALITSRLLQAGWQVVDSTVANLPVQLVLVNSCSVTGTAAQKSRQAVNKYRSLYPDACIVVTGCSTEVDKDEWAKVCAADIILENSQKNNITSVIENYLAGRDIQKILTPSPNSNIIFQENTYASFTEKSRAILKIQEGCNNFCSYCIVPYARGRERSRAWDEVINEFQHLLNTGFQEIVLAGVNVCAYNDGGRRLPDLLRTLTASEGNFRIRLSSTEPHPVNMELLTVMAEQPKICRFLHLSLQHGTDEILRAMHRNYTTAEYAEFTARARMLIPDLHLGTDIIVGFPGETEALFEEQLRFIATQGFANMHIFSFSPRLGTPAAKLPGRINGAVVKERYNRLAGAAAVSAHQFAISQLGKELTVIFEKIDKKGIAHGWTDNYIAVDCNAINLPLKQLIKVRAVAVNNNKINAELSLG